MRYKNGKTARTSPLAGDDLTRAERIGLYVIKHGATVRAAAAAYGLSKSTVHKELSSRLKRENPALYRHAEKVLQHNKAERHIRGGMATKMKYLKEKEDKLLTKKTGYCNIKDEKKAI